MSTSSAIGASRSTVPCSKDVPLPVKSCKNFGLLRRDFGQSRVPEPPAGTIARKLSKAIRPRLAVHRASPILITPTSEGWWSGVVEGAGIFVGVVVFFVIGCCGGGGLGWEFAVLDFGSGEVFSGGGVALVVGVGLGVFGSFAQALLHQGHFGQGTGMAIRVGVGQGQGIGDGGEGGVVSIEPAGGAIGVADPRGWLAICGAGGEDIPGQDMRAGGSAQQVNVIRAVPHVFALP